MSLFDFMTSRHTAFLERELDKRDAQHAEEIKTIRAEHKTELEYARTDAARLQAEIDRLRLYVTSGAAALQPRTIGAPEEDGEGMKALAAAVSDTFMGTPFQKILQRAQAERNAAAVRDKAVKEATTQPPPLVDATKENTNGSS